MIKRIIIGFVMALVAWAVFFPMRGDTRLPGSYIVDIDDTCTRWTLCADMDTDNVQNILSQIYSDGLISFTDGKFIRNGSNGIISLSYWVLWRTSDRCMVFMPTLVFFSLEYTDDGVWQIMKWPFRKPKHPITLKLARIDNNIGLTDTELQSLLRSASAVTGSLRISTEQFNRIDKVKLHDVRPIAEKHLGTEVWYNGRLGYVLKIKFKDKDPVFALAPCSMPRLRVAKEDAQAVESVEQAVLFEEIGEPANALSEYMALVKPIIEHQLKSLNPELKRE